MRKLQWKWFSRSSGVGQPELGRKQKKLLDSSLPNTTDKKGINRRGPLPQPGWPAGAHELPLWLWYQGWLCTVVQRQWSFHMEQRQVRAARAGYREQGPRFCGNAPASQVWKQKNVEGHPLGRQPQLLIFDGSWLIHAAMKGQRNGEGTAHFCTRFTLPPFPGK